MGQSACLSALTQEDAIVGDKKRLAALTRMSGVEREMFANGSAMAQLLHGCRAALQRKLEELAAQRSRHEVIQLPLHPPVPCYLVLAYTALFFSPRSLWCFLSLVYNRIR